MKQRTRNFLAALICLATTLILLQLLSYTPFVEILELKSYDFRMAGLRALLEPPSDIVIVAIDESSRTEFRKQGWPWPWPRSVHAELIRALNQAGARLIAFDLVFDYPSPRWLPREDAALAKAIRESRAPVVLAATIDVVIEPDHEIIRRLYPLEELLEAGAVSGFVIHNRDIDTALRQARLSVGGEPSLAVSIVDRISADLNWDQVPSSSQEGGDPKILINFVGPARSISTVSYWQAIDYQQTLPEGIFEGKIVLVGRSLAVGEIRGQVSETDIFPSPFDLLSGAGSSMPGVEFHAGALNTLLRGNFIRRLSREQRWMLLLALLVLVSGAVLTFKSVRLKTIFSLLLIIGYLGATAWAFVGWDYWLPSMEPAAAMLCVFGLNTLYQYRASERERAVIRQALKGYVSSQVMDEVLKSPGKLELGGIQLEATVLFSDIAGFSKVSEAVPPPRLAAMLNSYFTRMGDAVMERGGMINKYIGDSIMAVWGAPLSDPRHAELACRTALAMQQAAQQEGLLKTRIGLNSGTMVAGNLGYRERMEYTVIGDAVNLASRLEGANKAFGTSILISETTEALLNGRFLLRDVDRIRVAGKEEPVRVFEVLACSEDPVADSLIEMQQSFGRAMGLYQAHRWTDACKALQNHLESFPDDPVAQAYLARCRQFTLTPPPPGWDGVYILESK